MGGLIFLVVIIVIVLWVLASCVRIVPQAYAMVVHFNKQYLFAGLF